MKLRKLGLIALSLGFLTTACACSNAAVQTADYDSVLDADAATASATMTSITVDTSKAKTIFYLGDEFSTEGLVLNAKYSDGSVKAVTGYSVDTSMVDMTTTGAYSVGVTYREGKVVRKTNYTIAVRSSVKETTPGTTFIGGIEVTYQSSYSDNTFVKTILVGDDFDTTVSTFKANVVVKLHTFTVDNNMKLVENEATTVTSRNSKLSIDLTQVDNTKVGTYMIKYTYTDTPLTIGGVEYENKGVTFTLVDVTNPVTGFEFVSGNTTFTASTDKLDLSSWKFHISRTVGDGEDVYYSDDLFTYSGMSSYVAGSQTATITLLEGGLTKKIDVTITESTTHDIIIGNRMDKDMVYTEKEDGTRTYTAKSTSLADGEVQLDESGIFFGCVTAREGKTVTKDGLTSYIRTKIESNAKGGYFKIVMDRPGTVILYMNSSGTDARTVNFVDASDNVMSEISIPDNTSSPCRAEITITKAGTYYVKGSLSFYLWASVVSMEKA